MSDFLSRLTAEDNPEAREVTIDGETGTVWFRRLSAGEREELLKGIHVSHVPGSKGSVDIDLGQNERQRHMLVRFSVCDEDGKRVFRNLSDVQKLASRKVAVLARHAEEVNQEDDEDLGKS